MKVDKGSSFHKLAAGKVETNQNVKGDGEKPAKPVTSVHQSAIRQAVEKNVDAASTISRVASASRRSDRTSEEGKAIARRNREDVERAQRDAADVKPEDVSNFADLLASRIKDNRGQALDAQANKQNIDKVHQLLQ